MADGSNFVFPEGLTYDCNACGRCCRTRWQIPVDQRSYETLRQTDWLAQAEAKRQGPALVPVSATTHVITHKADGSCTFLQPDNLCEMHAAVGYDKKPTTCQQFPFIPVHTPDGTYLGISHYCDAVQRGEGGSLERFQTQLEHWVSVAHYPRVTADNLFFEPGTPLDWEGYKVFEAWLQDKMQRLPVPSAALWLGVLAACRLSLRFRQAGVRRVTADLVSAVLAEVPTAFLWNQAFADYTNFSVAVVASVWEAGHRQEERKIIRDAMLKGEPYNSALFGRTVSTAAMRQFASQLKNVDFKNAPLQRYLSHVIFRKFLVGEPLVGSVCALFVAANTLDFFFYLSACLADREPQMADVWKAMDIVEVRFLAHAFGLVSLYPVFARGFKGQIEAEDQASSSTPPRSEAAGAESQPGG